MLGQKKSLTQIGVPKTHARSHTHNSYIQEMPSRTKTTLADSLPISKMQQHIRHKISIADQIEEVSENESRLPPAVSRPRQSYHQQLWGRVQPKCREEIEQEKTIKLKELYTKKTQLLHKLKILNRQARIKNISHNMQESKALVASTVQIKQDHPKTICDTNSNPKTKRDTNSRYRPFLRDHRVSSLGRKKFKSEITQPESDNSLEKDRKVLDFIKKMHEQTIKRDANRLQHFHRLLKSQIESEIELKNSKINHSTHFSNYAS